VGHVCTSVVYPRGIWYVTGRPSRYRNNSPSSGDVRKPADGTTRLCMATVGDRPWASAISHGSNIRPPPVGRNQQRRRHRTCCPREQF
jgi:hypothetical protein